ncbi:cytochrome P450 [Parafrankia sp. BMG5.11]|uniref:cytochrome P450 n=1 Tax=Parafrankia sp. BMG5.11 TaxID=222540 RepID=UPI001039B487|nr:cytochrome P450 [Parafrankia sp. BMG5.11]TCJ31930.1 cytochrome P450 [Parafrankia sp. BMG5.11]
MTGPATSTPHAATSAPHAVAGAPGAPDAEAALAQAVIESFDPAWRHDPYPAYGTLRRAGTFLPGPLAGTMLVPGHAECAAILADPVWSHAEESELLHPDSDVELPGSFLWMEPPDHTRLRGLVSRAFTPRTIEATRPLARQVVDGLIDDALAAGELDLIEGLAYPLPLTMICELLGVPVSEHPAVRRMSAGIARGLDPDVLLSPAELAARTAAVEEFREFFGALVTARRADPRDDLISALAQVHAEGDRLTTTELLGTLLILVVAGHETTVNLIGNGVLALLRDPAQLDALRRDPGLALPAVEEILRFDAPAQVTTRTARAEVTVAGRTFTPGEAVICMLGSANRDPRAFDQPDEFLVDRYAGGARVSRHLALGMGLHYCLGAPLVRLEVGEALRGIATRLTGMTLLADPPPYRPNIVVRGMSSLPVRVTGRPG